MELTKINPGLSVIKHINLFTITWLVCILGYIETEYVASDRPPSLSTPDFNDNDTPDGCEACRLLVKSFDEGLERTMRGKHEGGDTQWEEKNLKSYADSEVRLVEIQEALCDELSRGKAQCLSIAEEAETDIEDWWCKHRNKNVRLHDFLCINKLKKCCPEGSYGANCLKCPSDCNGHGSCDGSGTRAGTGECICQAGYVGQSCDECDEDYYRMRTGQNEEFECLKCNEACRGGCDGPTSANCTECRPGYSRDPQTNLCIDINECELGPTGMSIETNRLCPDGTYCVNTDGHYTCSKCHRACSTCLDFGQDKCITCALDYQMDPDHNCIHFQELRIDRTQSVGEILGTYVWYLGMLIVPRLGWRLYHVLTGEGLREIFDRPTLFILISITILHLGLHLSAHDWSVVDGTKDMATNERPQSSSSVSEL